jgi:hypothetical protein
VTTTVDARSFEWILAAESAGTTFRDSFIDE